MSTKGMYFGRIVFNPAVQFHRLGAFQRFWQHLAAIFLSFIQVEILPKLDLN